jgi:hypothetical protein
MCNSFNKLGYASVTSNYARNNSVASKPALRLKRISLEALIRPM